MLKNGVKVTGVTVSEDFDEELVLVGKKELAQLKADSKTLRLLHAGGVDNWEWYYESLHPDGVTDDDEDENDD